MKALLHLLRTHWRLVVLLLIVLLLLPAVVSALKAADEAPETTVAVPPEPAGVPESEPGPAAAPLVDEASPPAGETSGVTQPFAEYQEMIERPLFSSTRRPPVLKDEPKDNLDAQQLREAWRLSGIAMQQGRQLASFSERQGDKYLLLEQGMVLADEWRLEEIASDHVLLSNGASEVRMPLREPVATPPNKQQAAPAVPKVPAVQTDNTTPVEIPTPEAPAQ